MSLDIGVDDDLRRQRLSYGQKHGELLNFAPQRFGVQTLRVALDQHVSGQRTNTSREEEQYFSRASITIARYREIAAPVGYATAAADQPWPQRDAADVGVAVLFRKAQTLFFRDLVAVKDLDMPLPLAERLLGRVRKRLLLPARDRPVSQMVKPGDALSVTLDNCSLGGEVLGSGQDQRGVWPCDGTNAARRSAASRAASATGPWAPIPKRCECGCAACLGGNGVQVVDLGVRRDGSGGG